MKNDTRLQTLCLLIMAASLYSKQKKDGMPSALSHDSSYGKDDSFDNSTASKPA